MKKYAFGVDVGGTTCKIGFFETDGKLIDKWEIKTNKENGGASILSDVAQAIGGKLTEKGNLQERCAGYRCRCAGTGKMTVWYTAA